MNIFSPIRRLFAKKTSSPEIESPYRAVLYGKPLSGVRMTPDDALRLSVVWACVRAISEAIAASDWEVYLQHRDGNRDVRNDHAVSRILNIRPNEETTAFSFKETAVITACVFGNFFAEIERDFGGRPVALWPVVPERVRFERDRDTRRLMVRIANTYQEDAYLPYRDVFHLHGPGLDCISGFDVVRTAAESLAHAAAVEKFGASYFGNGAQMGGILTTEQSLTKEQINDLREGINSVHRGVENAHKFLITSHGLEYHELRSTLDKAQFTESRKFLVEEICRWFRVPPHKVAHLYHATFSNIEHQSLEFARDAVKPWARRMCEEATLKLFPATNWQFITSFDLDWLTEGDAQARANADATLVNNGIATRNEVRKRRGLNTLGKEADVLTVQSQNIPLQSIEPPDEDGKQQENTGDVFARNEEAQSLQ